MKKSIIVLLLIVFSLCALCLVACNTQEDFIYAECVYSCEKYEVYKLWYDEDFFTGKVFLNLKVDVYYDKVSSIPSKTFTSNEGIYGERIEDNFGNLLTYVPNSFIYLHMGLVPDTTQKIIFKISIWSHEDYLYEQIATYTVNR